jgi:DNA-binding MarR family transcriptional regulator
MISEVAEPTETERLLGTQLFVAMGQLARWSARQSRDHYGPGVLSALGTVVDAGPLRLGELAARLGVVPASISRTVAVLEAEQLVERTVDPTDRRSWFVSATTRGTALVENRRRDRGEKLARQLGPLTETQTDALRAIVEAIDVLAAS